MTDTPENIRRIANGSIDTAYYIAHCHSIRSHSAHDGLNRIFNALKKLFSRQPDATPLPTASAMKYPAPRPMTHPTRTTRRFRSGWREADYAICQTCLSRPGNSRKAG